MSKEQDSVPWWRSDPWLGAHLFWEDRNKFPGEELAKYAGQIVAWFPDGSGIRDAGPDMVVLSQRFEALGEGPAWYCYERIPPPGTVYG